MFKPILIRNISVSFLDKNCFEEFSTQIYPGSRIAIIGRNGSGKSSLLKILLGDCLPSGGSIIRPEHAVFGYVEQTINDYNDLSGGQRLNKRVTEALAMDPDILLLDEPTNHLDKDNRKSLLRMLKGFKGTLIVVSHDTELISNGIDTLWHIENNRIYEFNGSYNDYIFEIRKKRASIEKELGVIKRDKKQAHNALMKEQSRAKKRKAYGEKKYAGDKLALKGKQAQGQATCNKNNKFINAKKSNLIEQLSALYLPEIIVPKFSLPLRKFSEHSILSINNATIGYIIGQPILENINLLLGGKERLGISGKNASGKSTLLKAILGQSDVFRTGDWNVPSVDCIGYLDQHYSNLNPNISVLEHIINLRPDWSEINSRRHLQDFLFRSNNEVMQNVSSLSGGEKARLSLSIIACNTPKLLILDEITNNLDLETKSHVVQVLNSYPGAIIVVSHDSDFLRDIGIIREYSVSKLDKVKAEA